MRNIQRIDLHGSSVLRRDFDGDGGGLARSVQGDVYACLPDSRSLAVDGKCGTWCAYGGRHRNFGHAAIDVCRVIQDIRAKRGRKRNIFTVCFYGKSRQICVGRRAACDLQLICFYSRSVLRRDLQVCGIFTRIQIQGGKFLRATGIAEQLPCVARPVKSRYEIGFCQNCDAPKEQE